MKFYLVHTPHGHFQLFTNKKDANAYKKSMNQIYNSLKLVKLLLKIKTRC